jgi:hypothetical protein
MSLRRDRRAAATAAPRPAGLPRGDYIGDGKHGRPFVGQKFGAASKPKILDAAQRREHEARLRAEGRL